MGGGKIGQKVQRARLGGSVAHRLTGYKFLEQILGQRCGRVMLDQDGTAFTPSCRDVIATQEVSPLAQIVLAVDNSAAFLSCHVVSCEPFPFVEDEPQRGRFNEVRLSGAHVPIRFEAKEPNQLMERHSWFLNF
ncbi:uncharacterized protein SPSK_08113 [Sporothrix schenckii 1099-18]|uniref:Uncharacterized protein n=1 Tax=Sporothrix schenckii 1099-18 TaxID=1397361 RepID=A0A0F2MF32_SPOSC|nr:uncharacterized protein SPSK_08113 [Sporothrix schenckii 1099-18]KJR88308.1 hypothetical protein SPSK_08113 [Sporothrix schenckii 1099-18]